MVNNIFKNIIEKRGYDDLIIESDNPIRTETGINADPRVIVEYGTNQSYETHGDKQGEWVQVKMKHNYVTPTSYRIKSFYGQSGTSHMKEWILFASNDNKTWSKIDSQNTSVLNKPYTEETFYPTSIQTSFSIFRIVLYQSCLSYRLYRLSISEFDINGIFRQRRESCKAKRRTFLNELFIVELIMLK